MINDHCIAQAQASMQRARKEVHDCYGVPYDDIVDVTVSSDGTWQCHGFSSLFGAMFVIEHETKNFLDYIVLSKFCPGCKFWEGCKYKEWKKKHEGECEMNFEGSAAAMAF